MIGRGALRDIKEAFRLGKGREGLLWATPSRVSPGSMVEQGGYRGAGTGSVAGRLYDAESVLSGVRAYYRTALEVENPATLCPYMVITAS